eukprot:s5994_g2.t1
MREHSNMLASARKALDAFSSLALSKPPGDGNDAQADNENVEIEDERARSIRARHKLLLGFSSSRAARTKDAGSMKVQAELHKALKSDSFFDELSLNENWTSDSCWTMGMIDHFRHVEMELLGSSSQVYNRHLVCEVATNIITRVSKALLQDVQQWESNKAAEKKALKEEEAAKKMLGFRVRSKTRRKGGGHLGYGRAASNSQEKKVMDAAPMSIPAETKTGYVKTINTATAEFSQKFESVSATRPRITAMMECPAGALGMDALLMKEVDSCVQNAAGSGKPPASLVLDRGAVTSLQPVLLNQVKLDGDGELSDAEKKKETMKLKGNLGAIYYQRQGSKQVIAISYRDALAYAATVRGAAAEQGDQASVSPMVEALKALENMSEETECPQGLKKATWRASAYVIAGDIVYFPPCTLILEYAVPSYGDNVGYRVNSMFAPHVPELLETLKEMNKVAAPAPSSSTLCTIQALEQWQASGAARAAQGVSLTPEETSASSVLCTKPCDLRQMLPTLSAARLDEVIQAVKEHSAFDAYCDFVCGEMGCDRGPGEDQYEFGGENTDVPEARSLHS